MAAPAPVSEAASSQSSIEKRLASLENMMQTRNFLQVELQQQLNLLQDEVSQIRGVTEEQSYKLEKVLQRQRELVSRNREPCKPSLYTASSGTCRLITRNQT